MKKTVSLVLFLLLILSVTCSVMADTYVTEIPKGSLEFNKAAGTFGYKAPGSSYYKIIDSDGNALTPALYTYVYVRDGFYKLKWIPPTAFMMKAFSTDQAM